MKNLFLLILILFCLSVSAQEYKSFAINNVSEEEVWPAVYNTLQALKLPKISVNKNTGVGETGFYNFTALMIKNRYRLRFEYTAGTLTVTIFGRQYLSEKGWVDNMLPMTKKQASKLLDPIENRLSSLSNSKLAASTQTAAPATQQPLTSNTKKAGIYDDFAIIKTDDPELELLAIHENGSIIGYSLWENEKNVKSLVLKENNDAQAIILEFDEKGLPAFMKIQNLVIKISENSSGELNLFMNDSAGNYIGEQQVAINALPIETPVDEFNDNNTNHGPYFETAVMTLDLTLSDWLGYSSYALSQIANGLGKKVVSSVAIEFGKSLGVTLADPENKFFLNEISTCVPVVVTAITPFVQAALGLTVTAASISTIAAVAVIVGGLKISYDAWMRLKERHWPTPKLSVSGFNSVIAGSFGEWGKEPNILRAESNYPNVKIQWEVASSDLAIKPISMGDKNYTPNCSSIEVYAKETDDPLQYIDAFQIMDNKEIRKRMNFTIVAPGYYYMPYPNCSKLHNLGLITDEQYEQCSIQEELCKNEIWDSNGEILENDPRILEAILREHLLSASGLVDEYSKPDSKKLNMVRKIWKSDGNPYPPEEAGQFRSFVKPAPCMSKWFGFQDRDSIILLAHEAMGKIKINDGKIKTLQKTAEMTLKESQDFNNPRVLKIAADINLLEDASDRIRDEYGEKINKIAEKGTIRFSFTQTDRSSCYRAQGVYVSGAHWENSWLTILMRYEIEPKQCREELEYGAIFEGKGIGTVTCIYYAQDNKEISKGAIPNFSGKFQAAINFPEFEQIEQIDFFKSEPGGIWKESN
jgi:hypothetical protein